MDPSLVYAWTASKESRIKKVALPGPPQIPFFIPVRERRCVMLTKILVTTRYSASTPSAASEELRNHVAHSFCPGRLMVRGALPTPFVSPLCPFVSFVPFVLSLAFYHIRRRAARAVCVFGCVCNAP